MQANLHDEAAITEVVKLLENIADAWRRSAPTTNLRRTPCNGTSTAAVSRLSTNFASLSSQMIALAQTGRWKSSSNSNSPT